MSDDQSSLFDHLVKITDGYNVVVDLSQTDYFGSSAIGLFNRLVSHVTDKSHRIAFCNLSEHETEVIDITHLNQIWEIKGSRNDALQFVSEPVAS
jgi:anti-anti-sigma factor